MRNLRAFILGGLILVALLAVLLVAPRTAATSPATGPSAGPVHASARRPAAGTTASPLPEQIAGTASGTQAGIPPSPGAARPKWAALEEHMRWDSTGLELTTHPDGHATLHGGGRYTHMSAAVRDASGNRVIQCFSSYADMDAALGGHQQPMIPESTNDTYEVADY